MDTDNFENLIKKNEIYPLAFIERFQSTCPHWEMETWSKRERSLCHDMVCVLLANMEMSDNIEEKMMGELKRKFEGEGNNENEREAKRKRMEEVPSTSRDMDIDLDYEYDSDDEFQIPEISDDNNSEYEDDENNTFEAEHHHLLKFRYLVLEGLINAPRFQDNFVRKWEMPKPNKLFDIIDTKEEKLIEVKTTVNVPGVINEFMNEKTTIQSAHVSLIVVDLNNFSIHTHFKKDKMPGEAKATGFLTLRRAVMKTYNLEDNMLM